MFGLLVWYQALNFRLYVYNNHWAKLDKDNRISFNFVVTQIRDLMFLGRISDKYALIN